MPLGKNVKIIVGGAYGRMGRRIINLAFKDKDIQVVCGLERADHQDFGQTVDGVRIVNSLDNKIAYDCLVEFTSPDATMEHLSVVVAQKKAIVIGTTGLDEEQKRKIRDAARIIPVVFSPNMSVGVNLLFKLLDMAAGILKGYTANIVEAHHVHKKDAPSGTAKKIAEIINNHGFAIKLEAIESIRDGEIVGDHKVKFESDVDIIEISHSAKTRDIFAKGAVLAAKWINGKKPGLYSMDDILFGSTAK